MNYVPRDIQQQVDPFLEAPEIIAINGPRQSGKTTLLFYYQNQLIQRYGEDAVHFVSFEDELEKQRFILNPRAFVDFYIRSDPDKRHFFLLDEIQYVPTAGKILKLLYDKYSNVKFIVTGSASFDLVAMGQFLVGRMLRFTLFPFSFSEMLIARDERLYLEYQANRFSFKNPEPVSSPFQDRLLALIEEFLKYGGYPRVVLEPDPPKKEVLLKNIFSTYIEKDVVALFNRNYREKVVNLLQYLAEISGRIVNFQDISNILKIHYTELKNLLTILEQTFVVRAIKPFHRNLVTELKKNPKYFFVDLGLRNALLGRFQFGMMEKGDLLENYMFIRFKDEPLAFWRTSNKAEVDFVFKNTLVPLEVKITPKVTRSLISFINHYHPPFALIANWDQSFEEIRNNTRILGVPVVLI